MSPKSTSFDQNPGRFAFLLAFLNLVFFEVSRLVDHTPEKPYQLLSQNLLWSFTVSVIVGILGYVFVTLSYVRKVLSDGENSLVDRIEHKLELVDERLRQLRAEKLANMVPLSQYCRPFHQTLEHVTQCASDSTRWLLAKFIARKLAREFESFGTKRLDYQDKESVSTILQVLIPEATARVYFTFPYSPQEWVHSIDEFKTLCDKASPACKDARDLAKFEKCPIVEKLLHRDPTVSLPRHLDCIRRSGVSQKRRFVFLDENSSKSSWQPSCCLYVLAFTSHLAGITTVFVKRRAYDTRKRERNVTGKQRYLDENLLDDVLVEAVFDLADTRHPLCSLRVDDTEGKNRFKELVDPAWRLVPPAHWLDAEKRAAAQREQHERAERAQIELK